MAIAENVPIVFVNGTNKPVALARYGLDEARRIRTVTESFPKLPDCTADGILKVNKSVIRPKPAANYFAVHNFAGVFEKKYKDLNRLVLELDFDSLFPQFA